MSTPWMPTPAMLTGYFWTRVHVATFDACWQWLAGRTSRGYGATYVNGGQQPAHRVAYQAAYGPIPQGLVIDHLCRNRACCNPNHMEPVTPRENVLRGIGPSASHAQKAVCPLGHPYTHRDAHGARRCRVCAREQDARHKAKRVRCQACGDEVSQGSLGRHAKRHQPAKEG